MAAHIFSLPVVILVLFSNEERKNLPQGVQLLLEGVRTSISEETYNHLRFSRVEVARPPAPPPLNPPMLIYSMVPQGILAADWSFRNDNGPKYWGKKYEGCSDSKRDQSPIDIPKASGRKYDKYLKDMVFTNYDRNMTGRARNDGSRVVFDIHEPHIKISNGGLTASYVAKEFYFQWGKDDKSDSGHTFEGKKFPMELHIVHFRDEYSSIKDAKEFDDGIVIVVFFFKVNKKEDAKNTKYNGVTSMLHLLRFKDSAEDFKGFSLMDLTHKDIRYGSDKGKHLHFYSYKGTFTRPPCEVANWIVFQDAVELDSYQFGIFRETTRVKNRNIDFSKYDAYDKMGPNYRPAQKIGKHTVYESHNYSRSYRPTAQFALIAVLLSAEMLFNSFL